MSDIKISVVIPVYNSRKYLEQTVTSIVAQKFDDFEIILVDDGSKDGSSAVCDSIARRIPFVKVCHRENGGRCSARNYGLFAAQGEYITFVDNDDYCDVGFLDENYRLAKRYDADCVRFGRRQDVLSPEGALISSSILAPPAEMVLRGEDIFEHYDYLRANGNGVWAGLYKRVFLKNSHIFFDEQMLHGHEDSLFNLSVYRCAKTIVLNPKVCYVWLQRMSHSASMAVIDYDALKLSLDSEVDLMVEHGVDKKLPAFYAKKVSEMMREGLSGCCKPKENRDFGSDCQKVQTALRHSLQYLDKDQLGVPDKIMLFLLMHGYYRVLRYVVVIGYILKYPKSFRAIMSIN